MVMATVEERIQELLEQKAQIDKELRELKDRNKTCGRAQYRFVTYGAHRADEHRVVVLAKHKFERNNTIIIAPTKEQFLDDLSALIEDLTALKEKIIAEDNNV